MGMPYSEMQQCAIDEIAGGSPYDVTTIAGPDGRQMPCELELSMARFQGRCVANIAKKLSRKL